jgi:acyl-coenzyme A synthetase/AMP-(fatty) acid ligase
MLEHYKIPRTISFVPQMPRTLSGKTDKRALAISAAG